MEADDVANSHQVAHFIRKQADDVKGRSIGLGKRDGHIAIGGTDCSGIGYYYIRVPGNARGHACRDLRQVARCSLT